MWNKMVHMRIPSVYGGHCSFSFHSHRTRLGIFFFKENKSDQYWLVSICIYWHESPNIYYYFLTYFHIGSCLANSQPQDPGTPLPSVLLQSRFNNIPYWCEQSNWSSWSPNLQFNSICTCWTSQWYNLLLWFTDGSHMPTKSRSHSRVPCFTLFLFLFPLLTSDSGLTELPLLFLAHTFGFSSSALATLLLATVLPNHHLAAFFPTPNCWRLPWASGPLQRLVLSPGMLSSAPKSLLLPLGTIPWKINFLTLESNHQKYCFNVSLPD